MSKEDIVFKEPEENSAFEEVKGLIDHTSSKEGVKLSFGEYYELRGLFSFFKMYKDWSRENFEKYFDKIGIKYCLGIYAAHDNFPLLDQEKELEKIIAHSNVYYNNFRRILLPQKNVMPAPGKKWNPTEKENIDRDFLRKSYKIYSQIELESFKKAMQEIISVYATAKSEKMLRELFLNRMKRYEKALTLGLYYWPLKCTMAQLELLEIGLKNHKLITEESKFADIFLLPLPVNFEKTNWIGQINALIYFIDRLSTIDLQSPSILTYGICEFAEDRFKRKGKIIFAERIKKSHEKVRMETGGKFLYTPDLIEIDKLFTAIGLK